MTHSHGARLPPQRPKRRKQERISAQYNLSIFFSLCWHFGLKFNIQRKVGREFKVISEDIALRIDSYFRNQTKV